MGIVMSSGVSVKLPTELTGTLIISCETADLPNNLNVGDSVDSWVGNIGAFTQPSAPLRPTFAVDAKGYKYLNFASQSMDTVGSYVQPADMTICLVYDEISVNNRRYYFSRKVGSVGVDSNVEGMAFGLSNVFSTRVTVGANGTVTSTATVTTNGRKILIYRRSASGVVEIFINNKLFHRGTITNFSYNTSPYPYTLFRFGTTPDIFSGNLYSVHVWESALIDADIQLLYRYCNFKTGSNL